MHSESPPWFETTPFTAFCHFMFYFEVNAEKDYFKYYAPTKIAARYEDLVGEFF